MLPGGVLNGLFSPIAGKLFDKFGPRAMIIPGASLLVIIMYMFTQITTSTSALNIIILHSLLMIAISMIMMPVQTNAMNGLAMHHYPHGTAILNTLQQVAGAVGVALFFSIMASGQIDMRKARHRSEQRRSIERGNSCILHSRFCLCRCCSDSTVFVKKAKVPEMQQANYHPNTYSG